MVRKIIRSGDPILRQISKPVIKVDKKILALVRDLRDTLAVQKDPEGVGLAAPQIGKNVRVFIISHKKFERTVINPEIISRTPKPKKTAGSAKKAAHEIMEGCLS